MPQKEKLVKLILTGGALQMRQTAFDLRVHQIPPAGRALPVDMQADAVFVYGLAHTCPPAPGTVRDHGAGAWISRFHIIFDQGKKFLAMVGRGRADGDGDAKPLRVVKDEFQAAFRTVIQSQKAMAARRVR